MSDWDDMRKLLSIDDAVRGYGYVTLPHLQRMFGCSKPTAQKLLTMYREGVQELEYNATDKVFYPVGPDAHKPPASELAIATTDAEPEPEPVPSAIMEPETVPDMEPMGDGPVPLEPL